MAAFGGGEAAQGDGITIDATTDAGIAQLESMGLPVKRL